MADALTWDGNWAWALPLIVVTLILHVTGLALINTQVLRLLEPMRQRRSFFFVFVCVMGIVALLATVLHAVEATIWAEAYRLVGALPDGREALLFSLNAITSYGHTELNLAQHWRLMGALEALNGLLLFGLTTAFLYGHLQRVWPQENVPWALRKPAAIELNAGARPGEDRATRPPQLASHAEQNEGFLQRHPHAPDDGDADGQPRREHQPAG
jgi:hypothetical protein